MKLKQEDILLSALPFVSVIIPCRNEASSIEACLRSLLVQDYPKDKLEILVVDGMSDDGTRGILQEFTTCGRVDGFPRSSQNLDNPRSLNIRILDNPKKIVPVALNIGIQNSLGDIIVRVDGHSILEIDYITTAVSVMNRTGAEVVGGLMRPIGKGLLGRSIAIAHNLRFGLGGGAFHHSNQEIEVDTVYMGVFRRNVFERFGYFDEDLRRNQDIEMNGRIRCGGGKVVLSPLIRSTYFCRNSLQSLWKQNYSNGLWLLPTIEKTRSALSLRHFIPLIFISALIVSLLGTLLIKEVGIIFVGIFGAYVLASLGAAAHAAARHGWRLLVSLPIVFPTLHFSYGVGSLIGLFRQTIHGAQASSSINHSLEASRTK